MAYILDTNIISEFMKEKANPQVIDWAQDHNEDLFLTTVSLMELNYGIMRMPEGKRKHTYREIADAITKECRDRIYSFDSFSAFLCAKLRCEAAAIGRPPQISDCMIAAICQRNNATLATHNVKDFEHYGIPLVDPFNYESETLKRLRREEAERAIGSDGESAN